MARQFMMLRERFQLSVRAEAYSISITRNWGAPNMSVFSPSFGKIFSKSNPRTLQLGVKLAF
jgi:hypothetical protein